MTNEHNPPGFVGREYALVAAKLAYLLIKERSPDLPEPETEQMAASFLRMCLDKELAHASGETEA